MRSDYFTRNETFDGESPSRFGCFSAIPYIVLIYLVVGLAVWWRFA